MPGFDIVMHVRNTDKFNSGFRNWHIGHATEFAKRMTEAGYTVACIGRSTSSMYVPGNGTVVDMRNVDLDMLATVMQKSKVFVGSQSGPTHFAALCGLPIVCWQTKAEHARRVAGAWNPFNVKVVTIPADDSYWKLRQVYWPDIDLLTDKVINACHGK